MWPTGLSNGLSSYALCPGRVSSSLANISAISTTHINETALSVHRDSSTISAVVPQSTDVIGRHRQPITDLDSVDLTTATAEPFLDGCRVRKQNTLF